MNNNRSEHKILKGDVGATLPEACVVISLILLFVSIIIDCGYIFLIQNVANRAAYQIIESAKIDERFASETRTFGGSANATSASKQAFRDARAKAINEGVNLLGTVSRPSSTKKYPYRLQYKLPDFDNGYIAAEGALLYPGQSVILENPNAVTPHNPQGEETYSHIRIDRMADPDCQRANPPASCSCDSTSCPGLLSPGATGWMSEALKNPPMAMVSVQMKPLLFLRFFRPTMMIVGRAFASPERVPKIKNLAPPGLTCGMLYPADPHWLANFAGHGRDGCIKNNITCPQPSSGPPHTCMRAPDSTETVDGTNCGVCRPITCNEMYQHGGVNGAHWTGVWGQITETCRSQLPSGTSPDQYGQVPMFGDLNNNWAPTTPPGWGAPIPPECVNCRRPNTCAEAYSNSMTLLPPCPSGQQWVFNAGSWDYKPPSQINIANCLSCTAGDPPKSCQDENPAPPTSCPSPVFLPGNSYVPTVSGGNCWACNGTCASNNVSVAAACGTCSPNENCTSVGSVVFESNAKCCYREWKPCTQFTGSGTCSDPAVLASFDAQGKDCKMVGTAPTCTAVGVCRNTCPPRYSLDQNCQCVCTCPTGTFRPPGDTSCLCVPTLEQCDPPRTSCPTGEVLWGTCCVREF